MGMEPPTAQTPPPAESTLGANDPIGDVAEGQKLIIYAILVNILAAVLSTTVDQIFGLVGLGAIVLAIVGLLRLAGGMGWSTGIKGMLIILSLVPFVGFVMLVIVNARATERLQANGYKVGLLGAKNA